MKTGDLDVVVKLAWGTVTTKAHSSIVLTFLRQNCACEAEEGTTRIVVEDPLSPETTTEVYEKTLRSFLGLSYGLEEDPETIVSYFVSLAFGYKESANKLTAALEDNDPERLFESLAALRLCTLEAIEAFAKKHGDAIRRSVRVRTVKETTTYKAIRQRFLNSTLSKHDATLMCALQEIYFDCPTVKVHICDNVCAGKVYSIDASYAPMKTEKSWCQNCEF